MLKFLLSLLLIATASLASAEQTARWYRYYDDSKQANVTDNITPEHVARGYDELTASMQVIRHVAPQKALTPQEIAAARAKRDADAQRAKDDKQLLRLYSSPADAEHARDRQLDALQLRVDFSSNALTNLRQRRASEAQKAAVFERTGKPVPADLKQSIANYDKQVLAAQAEITQRKADQDKVRAEFTPTIQRLVELTGKPAASTPAATPAMPPAAKP